MLFLPNATNKKGTTMSRLQLLTTKFKNMRKLEDESTFQFNVKLCDIANNSSALGEKKSEEKLVRIILRSLPRKFDLKVAIIQEAQDLSTLKVDELIGSLQTFEVSMIGISEKKNKGVAFVSNSQEDEDQGDKDTEENMSDVIAYVGRKFNKALKNLDKNWRTNVQDIRYHIGPQRKRLEEDRGNKVRCFECEGFGHIKVEWPTFLKKQKRGLSSTWLDPDSESETANSVMAFTRKFESKSVSSDEDMTDEELVATYMLLYTNQEEARLTVENKKETTNVFQKENEKLVSTITGLEEEVSFINSKIVIMTKFVCMLNNGSSMLGEILEVGKIFRSIKGIDFESNLDKVVLPNNKTKLMDYMSQHHAQHVYPQ